MNAKFGLVVSAAVMCAVMSGCKATKVQSPKGNTAMEPTRPAQQTQVVVVDEKPAQTAETAKPAPVTPAPEKPRCKCAPGTMHDAPCACGAPNCKCKVKAPEPEYTLYRVKSGDMLSSICKTYGLKQRDVLKLNPGLDPNKLYAGRKIKLPGTIELKGDAAKSASAPAKAAAPAAAKPAAKAAAKPAAAKPAAKVSSYKGATKEYAVQNGDTLGKIAYSNGITIKCLKEMNGLKNNNIRIGQKLKVPAEKPVAEAKPAAAEAKKAEAAKSAAAPAPDAAAAEAKPAAEPAAAPAADAAAPAAEKPVESAAAVEQVKETSAALEPVDAAPKTHTVKEGEDMVSIAILYNVSPSAIMDLNDLKNTDQLTPGQVLKLPANAKMQ